MKSILKISIVFLSLIIIVSCRKSESNQATTTDWRTSMAAFGKEVVAVAKASEIIDASVVG